MKKAICLLLLSLWAGIAFCQDIHWSQYNDNPVFQNPANSGKFEGDYRFHANYRDQWRSVTVPYMTLSISADTRIKKYNNIGIGLLFFHDQAGDGTFRTIEFQVAPSYSLKLSHDSVHTLRAGIQLGMNHRQLNMSKFSFDNQFNGIIYDPSLSTNEVYQNQRNTNFSAGTGLVYEWFIHKRKRISAGVGWFNINTPDQGFYGQKINRDRRVNIFARGQFRMNDELDLMPSFHFNAQGTYKEIIFGTNVRYILSERMGDYKALYAGAFYRNKDAGYISLGMDYHNWFAGISYDLNFSKLVPASRVRGGIEVALRYIITSSKPKSIIHRICPDFI